MSYLLEGTLMEVCDCNVICPCWVGKDPDNENCHAALAWHFKKGDIDGTDVAGLTIATAAILPGNVTAGNWRVVVFVDDNASTEQEQALLEVFTGKKGGPVADLVQLIGEVVAVERAPITFEAERGKAKLTLGDTFHTEVEPFMVSGTGEPAAMRDVLLSTIPGEPAYASQSSTYRFKSELLNVDIELSGRSSVQTAFRYQG